MRDCREAFLKAIYEIDRRATLAPNDKAKTDDRNLALGTKAKFGDLGRFEMNLSYRSREVTTSSNPTPSRIIEI